MPSHRPAPLVTPLAQLRQARAIVAAEADALTELAGRLDGEFCRAVELFYRCRGSVIATGMGKAGLIARKVVATLASTGTPSHFLHPSEAVHGDLGRVGTSDVLLALSQSGETEEIVRLLPALAGLGTPLVAIVGSRTSTLARAAEIVIELGPLGEAGPLGLAPTTSTTAMLAVGDALALVTSQMRGFDHEDFARFHPAGNLGRRLARVEQYMRPLAECRLAPAAQRVRQVFVDHSRAGRRTGAIMLTNERGCLAGVFTDSDLARLFEHNRDDALDRPIGEVMTTHPLTVGQGSLMVEAVAMMAQRKISELPVLDALGRPLGLVDITDVVGLFPEATASAEPSTADSRIPPRECA